MKTASRAKNVTASLMLFIFFSCSKSNDSSTTPPPNPPPIPEIQIQADFDMVLSDTVAHAQLELKNKTTGATSYEWSFSTGIPATSSLKDPGKVSFDASGTYTIQLKAINSTQSKIVSKSFSLKRSSALKEFTDITLGVRDNHLTKGACFSTITGKVYRPDSLTVSNGPLIDITLVGLNSARFFCSPLRMDTLYNSRYERIPGATSSKFINYYTTNIPITVADFDGMKTDSILQNLTITDDVAIYTGRVPPFLVFFQNANGQKGIIKVKEDLRNVPTAEMRVVFDIKCRNSSSDLNKRKDQLPFINFLVQKLMPMLRRPTTEIKCMLHSCLLADNITTARLLEHPQGREENF